MSIPPRTLILRRVLGAEGQGDGALQARELLPACARFGLPENRVRFALARAVAAGLLVAPRRGAAHVCSSSRAAAPLPRTRTQETST
jgi:DNA-binding transcriptional regulator PaaX